MNGFGKFLLFSAGAAVGGFVAWKILDKKYKEIADEKIASIKEVYSKKYGENEEICGENKENIDADISKTDVEDKKEVGADTLRKVVDDLGYTSYSTLDDKKGETVKKCNAYVIPPESFDEEGYRTISLVYYADKVLAYESGKVIEKPDEVVGAGSLSTFGDYEDDSVFVRNDDLKVDYEILADERTYSSVYKK